MTHAKMTRDSFHVFQANARNALKQSEQVPSVLICAGTGCIAGGAMKIYDNLKAECEQRGLKVYVGLKHDTDEEKSLHVKMSGCHGFCEMGPLVHIEPLGVMYIHVKPEDCHEILEKTVLGGEIIDRLVYHLDGVAYPRQADIPFYKKQHRVVLENCGSSDAEDIEEYIAKGGYAGFEKALFEMTGEGMREVTNASEALLSERAHDASGSVVMCALEGTRPLLTDVQALVARAPFGTPRRMASGVDQGRLSLLLAVLEKRAGLRLFDQDVYINIAGGMTLTEPAADLALCMAVASSLRAKPIDGTFAVMGEVGLAGEVRAVPQAERRLNECLRLGFRNVVLPKGNLRGMRVPEGMQVHPADTVLDAIAALDLFDRR